MIIVKEIKGVDDNYKTANVSIFADTKAEVATGTIEGMPEGYSPSIGSTILTAAGEVAFMKSNGSWNWV